MSSHKILTALLVIAVSCSVYAQDGQQNSSGPSLPFLDDGEKSITKKDLYRHVSFLASDEMRGRLAGTPEAKQASEYIRDHMKELGLKPRGSPRKSWFYKFRLPGAVGRNVVGVLPGTHSSLKKQYVVIGAHLDHAGMGQLGRDRSRAGEVHNGADDNGSGTVGLLELAEAFSQHPTKRSLLFIAFSAEEWGLVGSKAYCKKPSVPVKSMALMINLDMIGRAKGRYLFVGGVHTGKGLFDLLKKSIEPFEFELEVSGGGPGPSDMAPFYAKQVPVLFFTTGLHDDYHLPGDDVEKLNLGMERDVLRSVYRLVRSVADAPKKPKWLQDDRQAMPQAGNRGTNHARVMLGIRIPGSSGEGDGVRVDKLSSKSTAKRAGIRKGDRIIAVDKEQITSPVQLQKLLGAARYGTTIKIKVRRGKKTKTYKVKLVRR